MPRRIGDDFDPPIYSGGPYAGPGWPNYEGVDWGGQMYTGPFIPLPPGMDDIDTTNSHRSRVRTTGFGPSGAQITLNLTHPAFKDLAQTQNNPFSMRPFGGGNRGIGLTGLDPKFINDPRFDYEAHLGSNPEESRYAPVVLMGNRQRDDYDSAPVGTKSTLAVDQPLRKTMADMRGESTGPSDWFTQNTRDITGGRPVTPNAARQMVYRMLMTRNRIEDRY